MWFVSVDRPGYRSEWDFETLGPPDPTELVSTRRPTSGDFSRHIPRRAFSTTTGGPLELESGLEHDLVKWLDLRQDVTWLVAQPVRLYFPLREYRKVVEHTPDLLSMHVGGLVTLWDAKLPEKMDDLFWVKAEQTEAACRTVGWGYEIFDGLPAPNRMNLLWLNGYRRHMPWHPARSLLVRQLLEERPRQLGLVRAEGDVDGELLSTVWHLIATQVITCGLDRPITDATVLTWKDGFTDTTEAAGCPCGTATRPEVSLETGLRRRLMGWTR